MSELAKLEWRMGWFVDVQLVVWRVEERERGQAPPATKHGDEAGFLPFGVSNQDRASSTEQETGPGGQRLWWVRADD